MLAILLTLTAMGTALGLFISAKVKNQFLAIELAVVLAYMPSLMLSGFLFDLRSVPVWIEFVGRLLPPTYAVEAFKQCFLAGDGPIRDPLLLGRALLLHGRAGPAQAPARDGP